MSSCATSSRAREVAPLPLGVLVAATAGWIGYMIQQSLENALRMAGCDREVATVITQVRVRPDDPALTAPDEVHRPRDSARRACRRCSERGVAVTKDARGRLRRVVGSPAPLAIHEVRRHSAARAERNDRDRVRRRRRADLLRCSDAGWEGVDAVVDKDLAAAVLARDLGASLLMILTDVDAVYARLGKAGAAAARARSRWPKRRDWMARARSAKGAWRRRFAPQRTSCDARVAERLLPSLRAAAKRCVALQEQRSSAENA